MCSNDDSSILMRFVKYFLIIVLLVAGGLFCLVVSNWLTVIVHKNTAQSFVSIPVDNELITEDFEKSICITRYLRSKCVEGHVYYYSCQVHQTVLAPKLDNDGKPILCSSSVEGGMK
jgi:hypothetical protein